MTATDLSTSAKSIRHSSRLGTMAFLVLIPFYFILDPKFINAWFPPILGGICLFTLFRLRKIGLPLAMFLPISWFLLACAAYYGIGPMLYIYGNETSVARIQKFYGVDDVSLWRTNVLNAVSIMGILGSYSMLMSASLIREYKEKGTDAILSRAAYVFGLIGIVFTVLTWFLRYLYGDEFLMPGVFYTLGKCTMTSVFLYSYLYYRGVRETRLPLTFISCFTGFFAVTSLMKQNILEFAIVYFLGSFLPKPSMRRLIVAAAIAIMVFPILSKVTSYGRILIWADGSTHGASVSDIGRALSDTAAIQDIQDANANDQGVWRRLCYSATQAFAMDSFDAGRPGHSLDVALWAFVPRILYPDKPIVTQGDAFTALVKGDRIGGGTGAGYFGEAYWNYGWLGVLVMSVYVGALFAVLGQFSSNMVLSGNFQYFPVAFLALAIGYRVDDWLVSCTFNSLPLMATLLLLGYSATRKYS